MAEAIFDAMGDVLARWTMGSAAAPAAAIWKTQLGADPAEAELRLLALSGQFLGVAVTAEPPAVLHTSPDIPLLELPTMPNAVRSLTRRLLAEGIKYELLRFIAMRGWTVHPDDWMPDANEGLVPDVYAPWRGWAAAKMRRETDDRITIENWDGYQPAWRNMVLAKLRKRDSAAARLLLEAKLAQENADTRLRLLGILEDELSDADSAFLESIAATDRAPKVKALAKLLLSRLGHGAAHGAVIAELKDFFSVQVKGFIRRTRVIQFENAKTPAQQKRRSGLFEYVDLPAFSKALGMTEQELIAAWIWEADLEADTALIGLIMRTGTNAIVMQTAADAVLRGRNGESSLLLLAMRLTQAQCETLAATALSTQGYSFALTRAIVRGGARLKDPLATQAGVALLAALGRADAKPTDQAGELRDLGLITDRAWARRVMGRLNAAGLVQGDPRLDMLRLNEALEDRGVTS
jgi:hypothetical protein